MTPHDGWTLDALIEGYRQHQRRTRGLRDQTLHGYERLARLLVRVALGDDPIDPTRLNPTDVMAFVASMTGRYSPRSMKTVRTALRSFFRFLRVQGLCDERLEAAIPAVAYWRLSTLPRSLSDQQLERVLASLDNSAPCGRRRLPREPSALMRQKAPSPSTSMRTILRLRSFRATGDCSTRGAGTSEAGTTTSRTQRGSLHSWPQGTVCRWCARTSISERRRRGCVNTANASGISFRCFALVSSSPPLNVSVGAVAWRW